MPEKDFYKLYKKYKRKYKQKTKQKNRTLLAEMDLVSLGGTGWLRGLFHSSKPPPATRDVFRVNKDKWISSLPKNIRDDAGFKSYFKVGKDDDVYLGQGQNEYDKQVHLSDLIALLGNQNKSVCEEARRILEKWAGVGRIDSPEPEEPEEPEERAVKTRVVHVDKRAKGKSWFEYIRPHIWLRYTHLAADEPKRWDRDGWESLTPIKTTI